MNKKSAKFWIRERDDQRKWVHTHGGCLEAYVKRYGDPGKIAHGEVFMYGAGGNAIWAADKTVLDEAEKKGLEAEKVLGLLL